MIQAAVHDWLPSGIAQRAAVRARIEQAVDDWSADWFAGRTIGVSTVKSVARFKTGEARRVQGEATAASYSDRAIKRLLAWALDAHLDQAILTPADQKILDAFEQKLIEDLLAKLEAALGAGRATAFGALGGLEIGLSDAQSGDLLVLNVPLEAVLQLARASLAPPRPRGPLDGLVGAMADTDVVIDITLGEADLRLADLRTLAAGDVLILDTRLSDPGKVTLAGTSEVFARAALTDLDGQMAVTFQA